MVVERLKHVSAAVEAVLLGMWAVCGMGERDARRHK
jgi:hypothetical protein